MTGRWIAVLWLIAVVPAALSIWRYAEYVLDDTYISLRYAANLAAGNGLVFNVGERVEGYTNFLLVILSTAFLELGVDPVVALKALLAAMGVLTLWLTAALERTASRAESAVPPLSLLLLLPLEAFVYWSLCPMETMLFTAIFLAALVVALRERETSRWRGSSLLFVLLALTRPEGALLFAITAATLLVGDWRSGRLHAGLRRAATDATVFAVGFGPYFVWRWQYYGSLLPNTFYAKVTGGESQIYAGLKYLSECVLAFPFLAAGAVGAIVLLLRAYRRGAMSFGSVLTMDALPGQTPSPTNPESDLRSPELATIAAVALAYTAYVVVVGGDFMPFFRFVVPVLPLYCVLLACTLRFLVLPRFPPAIAAVVAAAVLIVHIAAGAATEQPYRALVAHRTAVVGRAVGTWLGKRLVPKDTIAVNTAGAVPYYSELPAIDMLGLTDAQIARRDVYVVSPGWAGHRRGWGEYVLARRPRIILWYNSAGSSEPFYLSDRELADDLIFRFFFRLRSETLAPLADGALPMARFWGRPFGRSPDGTTTSADLGMRAATEDRPLPSTLLYEAPIRVRFFEADERDLDLWQFATEQRSAEALVDAASDRWRAAAKMFPPPDAEARKAVEALCREAVAKIQSGDRDAARALLTEAIRQNAAARSPLVYQYAANLATLSGDLFASLAAQKEALRLDPDNRLYRHNLISLLTVPYVEATKAERR